MGIEVVTISLTDSTGAIDPTGATVTITNTDLNVTLLSTTWQGEPIIANISTNTNYTVSVSAVSGGKQPASQSYKAGWKTARSITFDYDEIHWIDLGLPSGLKWAIGNIVKNGDSYRIGNPTEYGCYFSWGNIIGYTGGSYYFNDNNYALTPGYGLSDDIPNNEIYDAAVANIGSHCHMPSAANAQELIDNCTYQWVTVDGVYGIRFTSKNNNKTLFFPAAGTYENVAPINSHMQIWLTTNAYHNLLAINPNGTPNLANSRKLLGMNIRAVK